MISKNDILERFNDCTKDDLKKEKEVFGSRAFKLQIQQKE